MKEIVELLIERNEKISTMESCTGGYIVNAITNIPNASKVLEYSSVTYSNEFKIKMGVSKDIIDKYTVYSQETAEEMAKTIVKFSNADYGIGITGKLKKFDENNPFGEDDLVYFSIYDSNYKKSYNKCIKLEYSEREENKKQILEEIEQELLKILNNK